MRISTATSILVDYRLPDAIDAVIALGFDGVDVWCGRPHLFGRDYPAAEIEGIGKKIAESGLETVAVMPAFFRYPFSLSSPVETIRESSVAYMRDCIDNAKSIGAKNTLVVPTKSLHGQTEAEARKTFLYSMEAVCEYARPRGVTLGIEVLQPRLSDFCRRTEQAVDMIRDLGSDNLGVVLDTGHLNLSGESLARAMDCAGERLTQIHINDNNAKEQQNAVPGEGNVDFLAMADLLRKNKYTGFLSLELGWQYSADPEPVLIKALAVAREIFG